MAEQIINVGTAPNNGTGDPLRTAFIKTDNNFDQIWAAGPVGTNVRIQGSTVSTLQVNQDLNLSPNGTGNIRLNNNAIPGANNTWFLGSTTNRWRGLYAGNVEAANLTVTSGLTVPGDVYVGGNLTVVGNTIQIGNIVTDTKTIQLSNTAASAAAANGSGITVGANDNIATMLYSSTSNVWAMNIGANLAGNVTAPYFFGNGSQLTGITTYSNANVVTLLAGFGSNTISTTGNITAGYLIGNGSQLTGITSYANANAVAYGQAGWAGNIIPSGNAVYSLGNATNQWNDLYVSNATIYMNNVPVSLTAGNVLTVNSQPVLINDSNTSITTTGNITADYFIGDGSQLTGIASTGNVTFSGNVISTTGTNNLLINLNGENFIANTANGGAIGLYSGNSQIAINNDTPGIEITSLNVNLVARAEGDINLDATAANGVVDIESAGSTTITAGGNEWTFDNAGTLIFPASPNGQIYGGLDNDFIINTANANAASYYFTFSQLGDLTVPVNLNVSGNAYISDIVGPGNGNVTITANTQSWLFDDTGAITLPSTGQIRSVGNTGMRLSAGASDATGLLLDNTSDAEIYANANVSVYTDAGNTGWTFDNTGNLTVPGIIQGSADSDYALKLGAAPEETAAGRWLQVRSGDVADHIHFDTSNNSAWNFYLGSDNQYVLIGNTGNISIGSCDLGNNTTYQWTFDNTGNVNLPTNGSINFAAGGITQATDEDFVITVNDADDDGFAIFNRITDEDGNIVAETEMQRDRFEITVDAQGAAYNWQFSDNEGILYLPGNVQGNYGASTSFYATDNGSGGSMEMKTISYIGDTLGSNIRVTQNNATISTGNAAYTWNFDNTGGLTAPGNISTTWLNIGNIGNIVSLEADVKLQIVANAASNTAPYWTFNNDGTLYVPGNISGDNSAPLIVEGSGSGEGYISLPHATFGGEQVAIVNKFGLGNGIRLETNGGNLFFDDDGVLTVPGNIVMPSGTSLTGSGASPAPSISGFTSVSAETLSATGNVTGGNISATGNITATNLPTKFTGSWSVPIGNTTQSFTVDGNNTYQMWVEGNIPNGIIAWNALVTITNTNVPVLGQQFAWNYEGAGNPIMLTSIPAQIIGTAGAISNASPAVANTNVFTFGINNASGNIITVEYGWVKIS
jgi:cytoskeletal protein CcmA (bactofilin family)